MEIDPRLLRYFVAVAEELNFNRAADRVHLSQPSLSVAIRKLEAYCGFRLFERNVRSVELTDRGRRLVNVAHDLIERNHVAAAFVQRLARGEPEILRVGYSPFLDIAFVGSLVSSLRGDAGTPVEFVSMTTAAQIKGLLRGELHAGLLIPSARESAIVVEPLRREPFLVALPKGHSLEKYKTLSLRDIQAEAVIWFSRDLNSSLHDRFLATCADAGYAPKVIQQVTTNLECMQFVAHGLGISFGTKAMAALGFGAVTFRELRDNRFFVETALAYRTDNESEALHQFVRFVRERCSEPG
jgi:DNA-binding transcriptional LysR family regulator